MENLPDIALLYDDQIPAATFNEFEEIIGELGLSYAKEAREHGPFAGVEWLLPTAVILFFGKAYFDSFFKEMGKDHYNLLKKGLQTFRRSLLSRTTGLKYQRISVPSSKIPERPFFSVLFSIMTTTKDGQRIKFLFPEYISEKEFQESIEAFLQLLAENYSSDNSDELTIQIQRFSRPQHTILVKYNQEFQKAEVVDPMEEIRRQKLSKDNNNTDK